MNSALRDEIVEGQEKWMVTMDIKRLRILRCRYVGIDGVEEVNGLLCYMVPWGFITEASSACLFLEVQVCPS